MVAYQQFVALSSSADANQRGQAAHIAAVSFAGHRGPAEENAALYAALVCFLDDSSVKVRAALAYGLLHARNAPRPIMVSLLNDAPVIARAVAQYSPVLSDADLIGVAREADEVMLEVLAMRKGLGPRVAEAMIHRQIDAITIKVLARADVPLGSEVLLDLTETRGDVPAIRGKLLARKDLPALARYRLIEKVRAALLETRIVKGAVAPRRLNKLMRDSVDSALSRIGERAQDAQQAEFCDGLEADDRISIRLLLQAMLYGRVRFFAACLSRLSGTPRTKVASLLADGNRAALNALFARCGMDAGLRNLMARLIFLARTSDMADDLAARHYVVTAIVEELLLEHGGAIPAGLEDAFSYLNEQNISLARRAARGVMPAFADAANASRCLPGLPKALAALPAA